MARLFTVRLLSAVRVVAARCKHPFALCPGLSQEEGVDNAHQGNDQGNETRIRKGKEKQMAPPSSLLHMA